MSLEQLLFFVLLLAIPLLERLITAMRGRRDASRAAGLPSAAAEPIAAGKPVVAAPLRHEALQGSNAAPLVSGPLADGVAGYAGTEAVVPPKPDRGLVRARRTRQDSPAGTLRAVQASQATRNPAPRRAGFSGQDLRMALVHVAILGPCRALEPRDPRT